MAGRLFPQYLLPAMTLMPFLCGLAFCSALVLVVVSVRLNPRAALNRSFAALGITYALWTLGIAVTNSARDPVVFAVFDGIAVAGYLLGLPTYLLMSLVFTGVPRRRALPVLAAACAVTGAELGAALTRTWVISGYHPGPWGLVSERVAAGPWPAVDTAYHVAVAVTAGALFLAARSRSHSRRFRSIALFSFVCLALTVALDAFFVRVVWLTWGLPDPSVLAGMLGIGFNLYLVDKYRYLKLDHPRVEAEVIGAIEDALLVFDPGLRIVRCNAAAALLLDRKQGELVGADLASLFPGGPPVAEQWAAAAARRVREVRTIVPLAGREVVLSLSPIVDEFGDITGGVAVARKQDGMDAVFAAHRITARERAIVFMLMQGFTNKEIADALFIAPSTVKNHVANIYEKTGAASRVQLFRLLINPADISAPQLGAVAGPVQEK
jgi:DNA-binding CsgD family transcriptional regulator